MLNDLRGNGISKGYKVVWRNLMKLLNQRKHVTLQSDNFLRIICFPVQLKFQKVG